MTYIAHQRSRAGFTLIETVVTVALLAVLAAFVVPTVFQKASAGDPVKVQNDLNALRTAIETFATDVRSGFPHRLSTLTMRPAMAVDRLIDSSEFTVGQIAAWNGPYVGAMLTPGLSDSIATGYTAYVMTFIDRYDAVNNVPEHTPTGQAMSGFSPNGTLYAALQVHGLSLAQAQAVNRAIDGVADNPTQQSVDSSGRFRYYTVNGVVVAWYLASPITKL